MRRLFIARMLLFKKKLLSDNLHLKCRASTIVGTCLHKSFWVHNGKNYLQLFITKEKIGFKFGDFILSRKKKNIEVKKKKFYGKHKK